jgi:hypothetical protein
MLDSRSHFYPHINQYKIHLFQNFESGTLYMYYVIFNLNSILQVIPHEHTPF